MRMRGIPFRNFRTPFFKCAAFLQLTPDALDAVILDFLTIMCRIRFARAAIEIAFANFVPDDLPSRRAMRSMISSMIQHSLRSAEAAESSVRGKIGFRNLPAEFNRRNEISIVQMKHRAIGHRHG